MIKNNQKKYYRILPLLALIFALGSMHLGYRDIGISLVVAGMYGFGALGPAYKYDISLIEMIIISLKRYAPIFMLSLSGVVGFFMVFPLLLTRYADGWISESIGRLILLGIPIIIVAVGYFLAMYLYSRNLKKLFHNI